MNKKLHNKKLTFGILLLNLGYNQTFQLNGSKQLANRLGINLMIFPGQIINSRDKYYAQENIIYDFISKERMDGLIIWSGGLNWYISKEQMLDFFDKFKPLPIISLEAAYKGIPSILMNNYQGMKDAINHLIDVHGHERIAFLSGYAGHEGAQERYRGYVDVLKEHNLPVIEELISPAGSWDNIESLKILEERKVKATAYALANNANIIDIFDILKSKGIRIPEDLAIVGFDNDPITEVLPSPLTIVDPPFYKMGQRAVELLIDILDGKSIPEIENIKPELIIRCSCGCISQSFRKSKIHKYNSLNLFNKNTYDLLDNNIKKSIGTAIDEINIDNKDILYNAFKSQLINKTDDFFVLLNLLLNKTIGLRGKTNKWQDVISAIRQKLFYENELQKIDSIEIDDIINQSRVLISEISLRDLEYQQIQDNILNSLVNTINRDLLINYEVDTIMDVASINFPKLNISSCYISIYENPEKPEEFSRLIMAYDENGRKNIKDNGIIFPTKKILPDEILYKSKINCLFIMDLYFQKEQIGFVVFGDGAKEISIYNTIRGTLSGSLKGAMLVQQITEHSQELLKTNSDLDRALKSLKENQEKLLISEKMASIGRLTAGIAHDINTPLAIIRASLSEISRLIDEYRLSANNPEITNQDHKEIADDMVSSVNLADKAAVKVAKFIHSIKSQTCDIKQKDRQIFNVVEIINDVLLFLNHILINGKCKIDFNYTTDTFKLFGFPGRMEQALTNLITNAIDAMEHKGGGIIKIQLSEEEKFVVLRIEDKGCGIPKENLIKIFDPMFTTKPFGKGSGLGLTIVHDIVYGEFGGSIQVESQLDIGTSFILYFKKQED